MLKIILIFKQAIGKLTSFRRDCDIIKHREYSFFKIGKLTSFRRDCDELISL